jgi:hypothetical protein
MSLRARPVRRRRARTDASNTQVGTHTRAPSYLNLRARDTLCFRTDRASWAPHAQNTFMGKGVAQDHLASHPRP